MISFPKNLFRAATPVAFALLLFGNTVAAQQLQQKAPAKTDYSVLNNYVLTMDNLHKVVQASNELTELKKKMPTLPSDMVSRPTLDGKIKFLEEKPEVAAILKKAGISGKDYVYTNMVLVRAAVFTQMPKGADTAEGIKMLSEQMGMASKQQLDFFTSHKPEIMTLMRPPAGATPGPAHAPAKH
jgi:hypothetical protein